MVDYNEICRSIIHCSLSLNRSGYCKNVGDLYCIFYVKNLLSILVRDDVLKKKLFYLGTCPNRGRGVTTISQHFLKEKLEPGGGLRG